MFNFLKKKIKSVVENFSSKVESELETKESITKEQPKEEPISKEQPKEESKTKQHPKEEPISKEQPKEEPVKKEPLQTSDDTFESTVEEIKQDFKEKAAEIEAVDNQKPKSFLGKVTSVFKKENKSAAGLFGKLAGVVTTTKISEDKFDGLFADLEIVLLENNVAMEVVDKLKATLKVNLVDKPLQRGKIQEAVNKSLRKSIESLFEVEKIDLIQKIKEKKPYTIMFAGINGSGKTTTIAKLVKLFQNNNLKCVVAASDTFRAAAIDQLQEHTDKLHVKLIKHDYGSDPAAVAFDAVKFAEANNIDVVLIDTAGRQHSNKNLIDEMKKVVRVAKPDFKIFVGEAITGNDCVEQAKTFNEAIGIDGIILAKADVDEKGGTALSISYVTKKPIVYLGTGQGYDDLTSFKPEVVIESLGLAA